MIFICIRILGFRSVNVNFYLDRNKTTREVKTIWCYVRKKENTISLNTKEKVNINSLIRRLGKQEEIPKLSSELMNLKELILPPIKEGETPEKWQKAVWAT